MEATLKLVQFGPTTEGQSQRGPWRKGIVVFETIGDHPKTIAVNFFNSNFEQAQKFNPGDTCNVGFDISSREFNGKWYTDVNGHRIESVNIEQPQQQSYDKPINPIEQPQQSAMDFTTQQQYDDLPF